MTDRIAVLARFLAANLGWMRHRGELDEFARDVGETAGRMRSLVDGRAEQKYLGPCRAVHSFDATEMQQRPGEGTFDVECPGDVYAFRGASNGRCRLCGAEWSTRDREAWLDGEVRDRAFRASEIASAYGLKANTIRVWHARGRLHEVSRDREDRPLFNVGDVLDLAEADAIRRHEAAVKRERRAAHGDAA